MRTESQIEASRANGARSRGPVTPEGKRNSSRNSIKHGLLASTIVLKGEIEDRFLEVLNDLIVELQPETAVECSLVEMMAAARWRQLRLWGMEKAGMDYQIRNQAVGSGRGEDNATRASIAFRTLSDDSRSLDLINRYDSRYERQYLRAHRRLLEMRDRRGPSPAAARPPKPVPAAESLSPEPGPTPESLPPDPLPVPETPDFESSDSAKRTQQTKANKAKWRKRRSYHHQIRAAVAAQIAAQIGCGRTVGALHYRFKTFPPPCPRKPLSI
jgi:hypothetical protein